VATPDYQTELSALRKKIDAELTKLELGDQPAQLYDAVRYVLGGKGKRIRPVTVLLTSDIFGGDRVMTLPVAVAMEVFHNFTLVHDDILDRSKFRRGRETVQVKWDEATAILTGDFLIGLSAQLLSRADAAILPDLIRVYCDTMTALCEGQAQDMLFESADEVTVAEYLAMIEKKTGALFQSCLVLGGLCGGAGADELDRLKQIGWHLGRAFQIQDDLLDVTASDPKWGKPIGNDLISGKKTILLLDSIERAEGENLAFFLSALRPGGITEENVPLAREKMEALGVLEAAKASVIFHSDQALQFVEELPESRSRDTFEFLIREMRGRVH